MRDNKEGGGTCNLGDDVFIDRIVKERCRRKIKAKVHELNRLAFLCTIHNPR